jgi:hypothetical protein
MYTGHQDWCIIKSTGQDGCFADHILIFLFAPISSELVQVRLYCADNLNILNSK